MAARHARRTRKGAAWALGSAGVAALAHYLPSVCVLGQWAPVALRALPKGWCRWRGPGERAVVALTFDDGPSPDSTPDTLDLLDDLGLRATFFVLGCQAAAYPELVQEMLRRGHEVGTHGQRHEHHLLRTPAWIARDLAESVDVLTAVTGRPPRWYRPTYGQLTARTVLEARRHDLEVVLWSSWGHEWTESEAAPVLRRLRPGLEPGAIVLLHDNDVSCPSGTGALVRRVLPELAAELHARGLRSVALDDLLRVAPAPLTVVDS